MPITLPLGGRWEVGGQAFGATAFGPLLQHGDLQIGETTFTEELAVAFFGRPGGHDSASRNRDNIVRVLGYVSVSEQREGGGLAGTMTTGAIFVNDGSDMFAEGERFIRKGRSIGSGRFSSALPERTGYGESQNRDRTENPARGIRMSFLVRLRVRLLFPAHGC